MEDYKTTELVDMKNAEAVAYAAQELGLSTGRYRAFAEKAGTYNRKAIEKYIVKHFDPRKH